MIELDIDIEEIEKIKDPNIKFIVNQLKINGFAVYKERTPLARKLSRMLPEYRKSGDPKIIIGYDRYLKPRFKTIAINPMLVDPQKELEKFVRKIMKKF